MPRIVTMHQPNYLPWTGLFSKISQADCFVFTDVTQYQRHTFINRNKIRTNAGSDYLTIPISRQSYSSMICDVALTGSDWLATHWKSICCNYGKTDYFGTYKQLFRHLYHKDYTMLAEINMEIITLLVECFGIQVSIFKASDLDLDSDLSPPDLIIAAVKRVGACQYRAPAKALSSNIKAGPILGGRVSYN